MIERSVEHATFVVERTYDASPSRVFTAWADPAAKARWFGNPDAGVEDYELDFKVGGREFNRGTVEGQTYTFEARYQDIVSDERLGEPSTNRELFDLLARHGWIDDGLGGRLRRMAGLDRKSTRLNSSHWITSRMPSSA